MNSMRIQAVAGDRGGFNAITPVLSKALDAGCSVALLLSATCARLHEEGSLPVDQRIEVGTDLLQSDTTEESPDLLLVGASQSVEGTTAAAKVISACHEEVPIVVVEDYYGSVVPLLLVLDDESFRQRNIRICVINAYASHHLQRTTEGLSWAGRVAVTGGPQFDQIPQLKAAWEEERQRLRRALGVRDDQSVFYVVGQSNGTAEIIAVIEHTVQCIVEDIDAVIIYRLHPRATWLDRALLEYAANTLDGMGLLIDVAELAPTSEALLPAADFVLSGYSTTNHFGILCGMPGVVYVGTPSLLYDLNREKGLKQPLEAAAGLAWYAETPEELAWITKEVQQGDASQELDQIRATQKRFALKQDGCATERVWQEVLGLVGRT